MGLVRENVCRGARDRRMHNIAEYFVEVYNRVPRQETPICVRTMRSTIRKRLKDQGIEQWDYANGDVPGGEAGDLRAHGDAIGGHGLGLEMVQLYGAKRVLLNESNYNTCKTLIGIDHL